MSLRYAVVTPARNEQDNLPRLAAALAAQELDAGRVDRRRRRVHRRDAATLIAEFAVEHPWARALPRARRRPTGTWLAGPPRGPRPGGFRFGVAALDVPFDVVVKVDADVDFEPDYFAALIGRFADDPTARDRQRHVLRARGRRLGAPHEVRHDRVGRLARLPQRLRERPHVARAADGLGRPRRGQGPAARLRDRDVRRPAASATTAPRAAASCPRCTRARPSAAPPGTWATARPTSRCGPSTAARASRPPWRCCGATAAAAVRREPRCPDGDVIAALRDRQRLRATLRRGAPAS